MLLLRLWNYLRGYVIIIVEGYFIEKFMNICTRRQILLWDIKRKPGDIIVMRVSIKGYKMLRPVARKSKCRVRIVKKRGLPFILNRYRKRKAFALGGVLFLALMFVMTSFIWSVEITGNKTLKEEALRETLQASGIRPGILKYRIDTDKAVDNIMLNVRDISWISIDVKGTKVKVQLRERVKLPDIVPRDKPCDVVAAKDGFIKQIIATDGLETAAAGDTVKRGQVLITGRIPILGEKDKFRLVHAMGTVKARTWYEEQCPVRLQENELVRTGRVVNNYILVLFAQKIGLFNKKVEFGQYEKLEEKKELSIGSDLVLPFGLVVDRYYENITVRKALSEDEAKKAASDEAYRKAMARVPDNTAIVKSEVKFIEDEDRGLMAKVTVECIEDIASTKAIGGN